MVESEHDQDEGLHSQQPPPDLPSDIPVTNTNPLYGVDQALFTEHEFS